MMEEEQLLDDQERSQLDELGYLPLGKLLSDHDLAAVRQRISQLLILEGDNAGSELFDSPHIRHPRETGADRLANLVNKGEVFTQFFSHPRLLAAVEHILGRDFRLSSLNYRGAKPGSGEQKLHADWREAVSQGDFRVCNSIWLLEDFSEANGATRFVPGSHRWGQLPEQEMSDPWSQHPQQQLLESPAGTVVVFNAHLWHGGTTNHSSKARPAIHSYFCRSDQPQQTDQQRFLTEETANRLAPDILRLLTG